MKMMPAVGNCCEGLAWVSVLAEQRWYSQSMNSVGLVGSFGVLGWVSVPVEQLS